MNSKLANFVSAIAFALPLHFAVISTVDAQEQVKISPDTKVAVVNGEVLTFSDMQMVFDTLQPEYQRLGLARVYPQLVERLIEQTLMVQAARKSGIDKEPEFKQQVAFIEQTMLERGFLDQEFAKHIDDAALKAAYDAFETPSETEASHILVAEEDKAKSLITQIAGGADFAALAKEHSTGPSGKNGGELGFFSKERMVPPFAEAAFATAIGSVTPTPVKTQYGWHVIKVTNRRKAEKQPFETMKEALALQLQEKTLEKVLANLKKESKIELIKLEGSN